MLDVKPLNMNFDAWSNFPTDNQPAESDGVQIIIIDPEEGSVTLPSDFSDQILEALRESFAVVLDR